MTSMKKSDKCEIRIGRSDFGNIPSIDVREFVVYNGALGPTKKGFLVPEENWGEFVKAVQEFKTEEEEDDEPTYLYVTTRSKSANHITKKAMECLESAVLKANLKTPAVAPAGYYLVRCCKVAGKIVSFKRVAKSSGDKWLPY